RHRRTDGRWKVLDDSVSVPSAGGGGWRDRDRRGEDLRDWPSRPPLQTHHHPT
ncbi:hypothetical protein M9458_025642, partial [Cirrhinus mrigala]